MIFKNDKPDYVESMCQIFADDAKIFRSVKSNEDNIILQRDLNKLSTWAEVSVRIDKEIFCSNR